MSERQIYRLVHDRARELARAAVMGAEHGSVVTLGPPTRSLEANALLHSLLAEAVEKGLAADNGRKLNLDEARTAFMTAWMIHEGHQSDIVAFGGSVVQLRRSTTTLTKAEFSSLVEFVIAECAHRNIHLTRIAT